MSERGNRKTIQGVVLSNRMDKTIVVRAERIVKHPVFQKYIKRYEKYKAHDETNQCAVGDRVLIVECRPLSREKRWRMTEVLERAK
ncbi:MAG: 30S ribosomal protein S17 [Syntrophales bacterium]|jgi:small subunit ribosomal protein S17|nr:30S ribosomal protein S17 [Syntrophales bacterium]MCK9521319.1 30S ribosomal protein S17 [Dehalococcoidia bacterium]MDD4338648.1 30S ribosomal protein S17 [Syntrophales bacterium]HOG08648.1 30S ribosomal protein S17 [Syntrophales bacterium]HOS76748.1 30S ribosomal protein S17 [Syntrophales bacterium]